MAVDFKRSDFLWLYNEFKSFFSTGLFYVLLGGALLLIASKQINSLHPSLIFLIAILGVAIMLYGTGTHAVGSGGTERMNVVIAGGAGVLAAVFGFGVIQFSKEIGNVFRYQKDYGVIELSSDIRIRDFEDYDVTAELMDGQPLHQWKRRQTIQVMVPIYNANSKSEVTVYIKDRSQPDAPFREDYVLNWASQKAQVVAAASKPADIEIDSNRGMANEVVYMLRRVVPLNKARAEVFQASPTTGHNPPDPMAKFAIEAE